MTFLKVKSLCHFYGFAEMCDGFSVLPVVK